MNKLWVAVVVLAVAAVGAWYALAGPGLPGLEGPKACTAEAMQCPDGSYVGRSGPNCEFVCPSSTSTTTQGGGQGIAPYTSGIRGTVMAGPTCPVMQNPPQPGCDDRPIATNVWISRAASPQQIIATTASDAKGMFEVSLPPGEYVLQAGSSGVPYPRCTDTSAAVGALQYTQVTVSCDTGIR